MVATGLDPSRATWRTSTYSNNGGACLELAAAWRKSSYSNVNGECVEVAHAVPDAVAIRDSKDPDGPKLAFTSAQWQAFTATLRG